ncbi:ATP phosphoribosyltransferase regulatory subunit [Ornithinibacillus xuwenensis]|uniref:ATP phosphoribosyltransferase regulatory subunit n=1 Tax=Ornithinibacillus xuwenensis TaxID=3144668 RepID=A0ABU9XKH3_9BACI
MESYLNPNVNVRDFKYKEQLINQLKSRIHTYGYDQISTSVFENYDLYTTVNGTINRDEMIKVISPDGKVLVLRPDVTIPITQQVATQLNTSKETTRYGYVLDIFRSSFRQTQGFVRTQAGVELFGNGRPEADSEVIALAIHCLVDLKLTNFKLELGHSGVMKEILTYLSLKKEQEDEFKQFIQSKNFSGLEHFLKDLPLEDEKRRAIQTISLLYGNPNEVLEKALPLSFTKKMTEELKRLRTVYEQLDSYGFGNHIVIDLGLINHMGYYSGIIFQGFIENIGKPILFGGRYDQLANQFTSSIPAVGFAFDIDTLLSTLPINLIEPSIEIAIYYAHNRQVEAFELAKTLREMNHRTIISNKSKETDGISIKLTDIGNEISYKAINYCFNAKEDVSSLLQEIMEGR